MSKPIKVENQVYEDLDKLRGKGATFSQVIADLLKARINVLEVMSILEGQLKFNEWKAEKSREFQRTVASRAGD